MQYCTSSKTRQDEAEGFVSTRAHLGSCFNLLVRDSVSGWKEYQGSVGPGCFQSDCLQQALDPHASCMQYLTGLDWTPMQVACNT